MKIDLICPLCHVAEETQDHLFMHCQATQALWFTSSLGIHLPQNIDINSWLLQWLSSTELASQLFCIILWKLWKARCDIVFDKSVFNPLLLAESAASFVDEFNIVNVAAPRSSQVPENISKGAPAAGTLKVNIDAVCMLSGTTCWGMIVRNDVAAVSYAATLKVYPMLVETLGLRWALSWLKEQHFDEVIIETDAEQVVNCLKNQIKVSEISNVILDCLALLAEMEQVSVSIVSRKRNLEAHSSRCSILCQ